MTIFPSSVSSSSSCSWIVRDRDSVRDKLKLSFCAPVYVSSCWQSSFALPEGLGVGWRRTLCPLHP